MWSIGPDFENVFFDESAQAFVFTGGDDLAIHIETEQMPADYFADLPARVRTEETSGDDEI
ncbi:MAG: hypothetical protein K0U84_14100 [Actinomycetia bacterium]|nr:hypothetical protein [Actinomycetes bacterium]